VSAMDLQEESVSVSASVSAVRTAEPGAEAPDVEAEAVAAVRATGLSKTYKSGSGEVTAVADVDLLVRPGECFGLIGPNGAGKSTTIGMLTTLIAPTGGRAEVAGVDVASDPMEVKRRIAVIGQNNSVDRELTIAENLEFRGRYSGLRAREARRRTEEMLERFGLTERRHALAGEVSGGQLRRMVIARALVPRPEILFLDEPTAGIDPQTRIGLWETLREMQAGGLTMVLTTHYLEEAEALCERVAIIDRGRVLTCDTVAALRASGGTVVTVRYDGSPELDREALLDRPGTRSVTLDEHQVRIVTGRPDDLLGELIAAGTRAGVGVPDANTLRPSLQSVYLTLTGRAYEAGQRA
jgi:ABC-type multidrug transport system ATPase subunit